MTMNEILVILQNRLINLKETRKLAVASGNLEQVVSIDNDIVTTKNSIESIVNAISIT
jgi:hypothetical protein